MRCLVVMLVIASTAWSQRTVVVPSFCAQAPGTGTSSLQWGEPRLTWNQCLFDVQPHMAGAVRSLAFRRGLFSTAAPAFAVDLAVGMSHAPSSMMHPSPWRVANHGSDYTLVVSRRRVAFPPSPGRTQLPYPFEYRIVFDRPFVLQQGRTGMWEVLQEKSDLQDSYLVLEGYNLAGDSTRYDPKKYAIHSIGVNCGPSLYDNTLVVSEFRVAAGARAHIHKTPQTVSGGKTWAQVYVGASKSRWGPLPLPIDLGPFGAPGCGIWVSLDAPLPTFSGGASMAISVLDIPDDARWLGRSVFLQAVTFGAVFNKLDVGTSQGLEVIVGPKPPVEATSVTGPWHRSGIEAELGTISVWGSSVFELGY